MIKFFIYLVFFGLLFLVLSRIFDVSWGRWYLIISVKDEIIRSIQGKLEEEIKRGKSSIEKKLRIKEEEKKLNSQRKELNFQKGTLPKKSTSGVRKKTVAGNRHKSGGENANDIENIIKRSIGTREALNLDRRGGEDDNSIENIIEKSIQ